MYDEVHGDKTAMVQMGVSGGDAAELFDAGTGMPTLAKEGGRTSAVKGALFNRINGPLKRRYERRDASDSETNTEDKRQ